MGALYAAMNTRNLLLFLLIAISSNAMADNPDLSSTKVVLLGTGTPNPEPDRSGPAVAIVVNDTAYLVDFGPGIVRRAAAMSPGYGGDIEALNVERLKVAFLTHLHSDHSAGLPDLILTPWVAGRDEPLELYGPEGVAEMADHILKAYDADIRYRLDGLEPANDQGWQVNAHTLDDGVVYEDDNVKVEAFRVRHGTWENAFGFRFTTADRVIVISGDVAPDPTVEEYASGADILIHEVYSDSGFARRDPFWQEYHRTHHTSASELGDMANRAKPGLLVLYHVLYWDSSEEIILEEVRENYSGEVAFGHDLDIY
jgi:ribonuclease BN (tRNA processing enzyme)